MLRKKLVANTNPYDFVTDAFIPIDVFYNETIDYFDLQRVGGLKSHLFNEHKGKTDLH